MGGLLAVGLPRAAAWRRDPNRLFRALYDFIAPIYDSWVGERRQRVNGWRRLVVEMLELKLGDQVLEVSVGTGANLPFICEKIGSSGRIYGLDLSDGMLAQAGDKLPDLSCPVELRQGLAEDLPYPDYSFDAVLHLGGVNFFTDRRRALKEMARVAKAGANIVVSDETAPRSGGPLGVLGRWMGALAPRLLPPVDLVPDPHPEVHYVAGGLGYAIEWRKATAQR